MNEKPLARRDAHDDWLEAIIRAVEQIVLHSVENNHRIIGFTAPERHSGVSIVSRSTGEMFARSGFKTLFVDLTQTTERPSGNKVWFPGDSNAKNYISLRNDGSDRLIVRPTADSRSAFNNISRVRQVLVEELADYSKIVIDIPPILESGTHQINPVAAAAACDSVLMVCVRGRLTRQRLLNALKLTRSAGGKITGTIVNDLSYTSPGDEMARGVARLLRFSPRIADWLSSKLRESDLLN